MRHYCYPISQRRKPRCQVTLYHQYVNTMAALIHYSIFFFFVSSSFKAQRRDRGLEDGWCEVTPPSADTGACWREAGSCVRVSLQIHSWLASLCHTLPVPCPLRPVEFSMTHFPWRMQSLWILRLLCSGLQPHQEAKAEPQGLLFRGAQQT